MIRRLLAILSSLALLATLLGTTLGQGIEYNIDRPGSDMSSERMVLSSSEANCESKCKAAGNCFAWTYVKPGVQDTLAICYLKSSVPAPVSNDCCISGVISSFWEPGIDRPGNDFQSFATATDRECASACRPDKNGCRAWTYDKRNGMCFLKKPVPMAYPNDCCTSGIGKPTWRDFE